MESTFVDFVNGIVFTFTTNDPYKTTVFKGRL